MIPMGSHSCFGDFPDDYLPEGVKQKLRDAQRARRGERSLCLRELGK